VINDKIEITNPLISLKFNFEDGEFYRMPVSMLKDALKYYTENCTLNKSEIIPKRKLGEKLSENTFKLQTEINKAISDFELENKCEIISSIADKRIIMLFAIKDLG